MSYNNALLIDDAIMTNPIGMGKLVETAVYKHVAAFYYQFATSVGYFRGGKNLLRILAFAFLYLLGNAEKYGYRGIE